MLFYSLEHLLYVEPIVYKSIYYSGGTYMPQPKQLYAIHIPNIQLLPIFYLLPLEFSIGTEYENLPRNAHMVIASEYWRTRIADDHFANFVFDRLNCLMWPAFHTGASIRSFSEDDPIWNISFQIAVDSIIPLRELGYSMDVLLNHFSTTQWLEYHTYEDAEAVAISVAETLIDEYEWRPIIDLVLENRCHEDFALNGKTKRPVNSTRYLDFYRRWNHTRVRQSTIERIEGMYGVGESYFHENSLDAAVTRMDFERFLKTLSEEELILLDLLQQRMKQGDIAKRLGYATHSAISKKQSKLRTKLVAWLATDL